jgi:hypothetical protein
LPSVKADASSNAEAALSNLRNCFNFIKLLTPAAVSASFAKSSRLRSFLSRALKIAYPADVSVRINRVMLPVRIAYSGDLLGMIIFGNANRSGVVSQRPVAVAVLNLCAEQCQNFDE